MTRRDDLLAAFEAGRASMDRVPVRASHQDEHFKQKWAEFVATLPPEPDPDSVVHVRVPVAVMPDRTWHSTDIGQDDDPEGEAEWLRQRKFVTRRAGVVQFIEADLRLPETVVVQGTVSDE